jgi:hypothetical protein
MNEPRTNEAVPVVYPPYLNAACRDDEISLVDLWIELRRYRRIFWVVFLLLAAGLVFAGVFFQEKYRLNTAIQIGTIDTGGQIVKIEPPESLKGKLINAIIPARTAEWLEKTPDLDRFKTEVSSPKNSDIVIVQNKIVLEDQPLFSAFQQRVAQDVLEDHRQLVALRQSGLRAELRNAEAQMAVLQDPRTLQAQLDKLKLQVATAEKKLQHLQDARKVLELGGKESVLRSMTDEQKQLLLDRQGKVDDRVLQARYEEILLDNQVNQDQQLQSIESLKLKLDEVRLAHQRKLEAQQRKIENIRAKLDSFNLSRVVSKPVRSVDPAGLSRKLLMALVVLAAGFGGFVAMLMALFRDRVRERLQEQQ